MNAKLFKILGIYIALLLSLCLLNAENSFAAKAKKKTNKFPITTVTDINYTDGISEATPGKGFGLDLTLNSKADWPEQGRYQLPVAFYLIKEEFILDLNPTSLQSLGLYLGQSAIRSPRAGKITYPVRFDVREDLTGHEGEYKLVAWIDPANSKLGSKRDPLFVSPLTIKLSDLDFGRKTFEIVAFEPDTVKVLSEDDKERFIEGSLTLQSVFGDSVETELSFCGVLSDGSCFPLEAYDPKAQIFGASYRIGSFPRNEQVTTLFRVRFPSDQSQTLRAIRVSVSDPLVTESENIATSEKNIAVYSAPSANYYADTDFAKELQARIAQARKILRKKRLSGLVPDPALKLKKSHLRGESIDLSKALQAITTAAEVSTRAFVNQENSSSLPSGLQSNIPGSRFNMPDGDFPWLKNIGVKADPPPERYNGRGFPNIAEFKRCIPFFCGPNSVEEAGREPSESCIRQFCGSTLEDIRFGGRNTNLVDEQTGFDKNFSAGGFGARVGVSGQAKVYTDKAVSDYVAASYFAGAFFGVKVFGYSVPIFEASSQAVYSPTELLESQARNEVKILGRVIERENKPSNGLSVTISKTYGLKKDAEIGLGPIDVDVEVEAGGTGGITLAIEQIDILRGIVGSLTPSAKVGARAKALTDITIGRFGIEGELTLIEDRVPVTATFNVGLDVAAKAVSPQLNFKIKNVLIGPNGRIKLLLEVGVPPLAVGYSTTIASFSTGTFETTIYDKTKTFGTIRY